MKKTILALSITILIFSPHPGKKAMPDSLLLTLPETGHDFSRFEDFIPQWKDARIRLLAKYESNKPLQSTTAKLSSIPYNLTREKTNASNAPVALLFSGDGGWFGFEQSIADKLALFGIPTIGIDTKK